MEGHITRREAIKSAAVLTAALAVGKGAGAQAASDDTPVPTDDLARIHALLEGNQAVKWVFSGDSITHGALHTYGWRDYPQLFEERVRYEMGKERNLVIRTATSGWTIDRLAEDLDWRVLQFAPQVASFHFGMNDCTRGPDALPRFRELYPDIIRRVREACGAAILIHTPNPVLPNAETQRGPHLESYVAAVREVAVETSAILVDQYAAFTEYAQKSNLHYLMNDALHPNEYGHRFKANLLFQTLGIHDPESTVCRLFIPR
ncbi:MAG TPA: SGNH/GDSL hydrolase family protein [Candidatus Hydrogenedentes bacterium]|jgi:lysophospholipase L1-like esterase|nr:SGNH/GDSL hydrolase family protein [FCB group bacterium]HNV23053.1 SGNH/GDSL hydrolase family protein [Candidatus Hydrogenedentota bacterium]HNZ20236.1 SGNH/GDSL hydrolase family protein [Candidatus Hydrogenedentota bacterium]HOH35656.1 SGNH/GDSL hydrolase family protein [Candidatus Hydrogenedentota bacterium]HPA06624.1 SGNH/GDSL hydrolase family protein [Candidatus Hydrogenedentota bacterium]